MATRASNTSVAISQMTPLASPTGDTLIPGVFGVNNYKVTINAINRLNTKETIGLSNVENLAPSAMPVSILQQAALDLKMDKTGTLPMGQVTGLTSALDGKFDKTGNLPQSQVVGLTARLTALETGDIPLTRISQFEDGVQAIIDAQPPAANEVVQGAHAW